MNEKLIFKFKDSERKFHRIEVAKGSKHSVCDLNDSNYYETSWEWNWFIEGNENPFLSGECSTQYDQVVNIKYIFQSAMTVFTGWMMQCAEVSSETEEAK